MATNRKTATESAAKTATDAATEATDTVTRVTEQARAQTEQAVDRMRRTLDEQASVNQEALDAMVKAGTTWSSGIEELTRAWMAFGQKQAEHSIKTANALMGARTLREIGEIQQDAARQAFDESVTELTKITEHGMRVTNDALAPVSEQVNATITRMNRAA